MQVGPWPIVEKLWNRAGNQEWGHGEERGGEGGIEQCLREVPRGESARQAADFAEALGE